MSRAQPVPSKQLIREQLRDIGHSLRAVRLALETDTIDVGATLAARGRRDAPAGAVRREVTLAEQSFRLERALEGIGVAQRVLARLYTQVERRKRHVDEQIESTRRSA